MRVSGFTFLRNGVLLGYPFIESIRSVLPICDEFVVAVGQSDDGTREQIEAIGSDKIRIIDTQWNEAMQDRGYVYAQQKMIAHFNCSGDWAFYLEGDEVLHEDDLDSILASMQRHLDDPEVEALVFDYHHFYGSPEWLAVSPGWYRRAPRIIRNSIRSYSPDGLFFVVMDRNKQGRYPRAALANAPIYHYGHVRSSERMREKINQVSRYWGHQPPKFEGYAIDPQALARFQGAHPAVMADWLARDAQQSFVPDPDYRPTRRELKHRRAMRLERWFGLELSKKHYKLVRD
ncbi:glycosyltransferase family protein [endosymbiont of Ridgeia piscesae]|jgi:glycosyltransferase involved in cell wall biosynthesis|uniref:Glycosyltransferase involved in cell wall bisynthesis n=1 Tax=endosymbiont of Ridgeia piscesae TaxID=54398 RepID=A0A0T5Z430_9GAMM|nr:glycosyl transferase [endosymbiont of Ridgeia piscesae]KRT55680.1 Glycosyltransferase involved in cell wall bisynthesis [endosymbiont of Ridgeia piscesae]KRT57517.1 Glycosyltransferase involved in cell wall bisynthesis [endosymbiont of Ridgeia piscesae]